MLLSKLLRWCRVSYMEKEVEKMRLAPLKAGALERRRMVFYGRVQGVGFRFEVSRIARNLQLTGFVQNLSSGAVNLEVQGHKEDIDQLLAALSSVSRFVIEEVATHTIAVKKGETSFTQV